MIPSLLRNCHRLHDFATDRCADREPRLLSCWKPPGLLTCTRWPPVIPQTYTTYWARTSPKVPNSTRLFFNILGLGFSIPIPSCGRSTSKPTWRHCLNLHSSLERIVWSTVEQGLIPVLDFMFEQGKVDDISEVHFWWHMQINSRLRPEKPFRRFTQYSMREGLHHHGGGSNVQVHVSREVLEDQKWLQIGKEKKLSQARKVFDQFLYKCISWKEP